MPKRVTQAEWDKRVASRKIVWREPVKGASEKTLAKCLVCNWEWAVRPYSIMAGSGCPRCSGRAITPDEYSGRGIEHGVRFLEPVTRSTTKTRTQCMECGYEWKVVPYSIFAGTGCPKCSGKARRTQEEWQELADARGLRFTSEVKGRHWKAGVECMNCGYRSEMFPGNVARGAGCRRCAGNAPISPEEWRQRGDEVSVEFLEEVKSAQTPARVRCTKCHFEWEVYPNNISKGAGCPKCAPFGFDKGKPGYLYLMRRADGIGKVGVTNNLHEGSGARKKALEAEGFELVAEWWCESGKSIVELEYSVFRWWRDDLGLPPALSEGDGHTETVALNEVSIDEIIEFIEREMGVLGDDAKCSRHPTPIE